MFYISCSKALRQGAASRTGTLRTLSRTCLLYTSQPINFYEPKGKGSEAYMDLAIEFVKSNRPAEAVPKRRRGKAAAEPVETMGLADVKMDG